MNKQHFVWLMLLLLAVTVAARPSHAAQDTAKLLRIAVTPSTQTVIPGGIATFTIVVTNGSTVFDLQDVEVTSPQAPDCNRSIGNLAANTNFPPYRCSVLGVTTDFTNTVTVTGRNATNGQTDANSTSVDVELLDLSVQMIPAPQSLPEPGGPIDYTVSVRNTGSVSAAVTELASQRYGDLFAADNAAVQENTCADVGTPLLAPGAAFNCDFVGRLEGQPGSYGVEVTAVAVAQDSDPEPDTVSSSKTVAIALTDEPAEMAVGFAATPAEIPAPGGEVSFLVSIENTSSVDWLTVSKLEDSEEGDVNGRGTCSLPQDIPAGEVYECSYPYTLTGGAGVSETRMLTVEATDDDDPPNPLESSIDASVTIIEPPEYVLYMPALTSGYARPDEPNDSCAQAYPLQANVTYNFQPNDVNDWYWFELAAGARVIVRVTNFEPGVGQVVVYGGENCSSLSMAIGNDGTANKTKVVDLGSRTRGRYYVLVINDGQAYTNKPYQLIIEAK